MAINVDFTQYTTPEYLTQLYNIEGHKDIGKDHKGIPTAPYGITKSALNDVARVVKLRKYKVSDELQKVLDKYKPASNADVPKSKRKPAQEINLSDVGDENLFKEIAQVFSYINATEYIGKETGGAFFGYTKEVQSALLLYFHNESPSSLKKSKGKKGSILDAISRGDNKFDLARTLLMDSEGNLSSDNKTRKLQSIQAICTPSVTFNDKQRRVMEARWKTPNFLVNQEKALSIVAKEDKTEAQYCAQNIYNEIGLKTASRGGDDSAPLRDIYKKAEQPKEKETKAEAPLEANPPVEVEQEPEKNAIARISGNFASWLKNLINGNDKGDKNVTRNDNDGL